MPLQSIWPVIGFTDYFELYLFMISALLSLSKMPIALMSSDFVMPRVIVNLKYLFIFR